MRLFLTIGIIVVSISLQAQVITRKLITKQEVTTALTVDHGLTCNLITDVIEDAQGFLWIGTISGLNRYDGANIVQYYKTGRDEDLSENWITRILVMDHQRLLIGTKKGLMVMHTPSGTFSPVTLSHPYKPTEFDDCIDLLEEDREGNYWISTPALVYQLDSLFQTKATFKAEVPPISNRRLNMAQIIPLPSGEVLFLRDEKIFFFTPKSKELRRVLPTDGYGFLLSDNPSSIALFKNRYLLAITAGNLLVYNFTIKRRKNLVIPRSKKGNQGTTSILGVGDDWLIFKTESKTYYLRDFNPESDTPVFTEIRETVYGSEVLWFYNDMEENLWAVTTHDGLVKLDKEKQLFHNTFFEMKPTAFPPIIRRILPSSNGLYLCTTNEGVLSFDPASASVVHFKHKTSEERLNNIWNLTIFKKDTLWMGSQMGLR